MIRHLSPDDAPLYRDLRLLALTTDPDAYFSTYEELVEKPIGYFQAELFGQDPWGYYGWFHEDALVGYLSIDRSSYTKKRHIANLYNLYVHPAHRHGGIGSRLVDYVTDRLRLEPEIQSLELTVIEGNDPAIALYTRLGFQAFGHRPESVMARDRILGEVFMMKKIA